MSYYLIRTHKRGGRLKKLTVIISLISMISINSSTKVLMASKSGHIRVWLWTVLYINRVHGNGVASAYSTNRIAIPIIEIHLSTLYASGTTTAETCPHNTLARGGSL
jgi:hypothetical protein